MTSLHLPQNWLRAVVAGVEPAVLTWLVAVVGGLVTYVATAGSPGLGNASWSTTVAVSTGWWTLAFGGRLPLEDGVVSLAPLGLTLLALVLLRGAVRRLRVDTLPTAAIAAGSFTVTVAALALTSGRGGGPHAAGALAVGVLGCVWALWGRTDCLPSSLRDALRRLPAPVREGLGAAWLLVTGALVAGTLLVVVAVATSYPQVVEIHESLRPDVASGLVLSLAQLLFLPNLALWALAWTAGPGFAVGAGTHFSAFGTTTELLPALPVLGALPGPGTGGPWAVLGPAILGLAVGLWRTRRASHALPGWRQAGVAWITASATTLAVIALLGTIGSGSLGPGRMSELGVHGPLLALAVGGELLVGYALALVVRLPAVHAALRGLTAGTSAVRTPAMATGASPATASTPASASGATAATVATAVSAGSFGSAATAVSPAEASSGGAGPAR